VTGRHSNQLSYNRHSLSNGLLGRRAWWVKRVFEQK
jgi:hypothetical protein